MPFKLIYELEKLLSICYNPKELAMTEQKRPAVAAERAA